MDQYTDPWAYIYELLKQRGGAAAGMVPQGVPQPRKPEPPNPALQGDYGPPWDGKPRLPYDSYFDRPKTDVNPWREIVNSTGIPKIGQAILDAMPSGAPPAPRPEPPIPEYGPPAPESFEEPNVPPTTPALAQTPPMLQTGTGWAETVRPMLAKFQGMMSGGVQSLRGLQERLEGAQKPMETPVGGDVAMRGPAEVPEPPKARQYGVTPAPQETWLEGADRWGRNMASLPQVLRSGGVYNPGQMEADPSLGQRTMDWKAQNAAGSANVEEANRRDMAKWESERKMDYLLTSLEGPNRVLSPEDRMWIKSNLGMDVPMGMGSREAYRWAQTMLGGKRLDQGERRLGLAELSENRRKEQFRLQQAMAADKFSMLEPKDYQAVESGFGTLDLISDLRSRGKDIDSVIGPIVGRYNKLKIRLGMGGEVAQKAMSDLIDFAGAYLTQQTGAQRGMQEVAWLVDALPQISQNKQQFWAAMDATEHRTKLRLVNVAKIAATVGRKDTSGITDLLGLPAFQYKPLATGETMQPRPETSQAPRAPMNGQGGMIQVLVRNPDGSVDPGTIPADQLEAFRQAAAAKGATVETQ